MLKICEVADKNMKYNFDDCSALISRQIVTKKAYLKDRLFLFIYNSLLLQNDNARQFFAFHPFQESAASC